MLHWVISFPLFNGVKQYVSLSVSYELVLQIHCNKYYYVIQIICCINDNSFPFFLRKSIFVMSCHWIVIEFLFSSFSLQAAVLCGVSHACSVRQPTYTAGAAACPYWTSAVWCPAFSAPLLETVITSL